MAGFWGKLLSSKDKAVFEAEKLRQITSFQGQIRNLQKEIEQSFATLGAATYRVYREGHVQHPELQQACNAINALQSQLEQCEREIHSLRRQEFVETTGSGYRCPQGHGELAPGNRFCPICGAEAVRSTPSSRQVTYCTNCGHSIPSESRFCTECGTPVDVPHAEPANYSHLPSYQPMMAGPHRTTPTQEGSRTCPSCGAAASPGNQWCIYCGAALDSAEIQQGQPIGKTPAQGTVLLPETEVGQQIAQEEVVPQQQKENRATTLLQETEMAQAEKAAADSRGTTLLPETVVEERTTKESSSSFTGEESRNTMLLPETAVEEQLSSIRYCINCGNDVAGNSACPSCGHPVAH